MPVRRRAHGGVPICSAIDLTPMSALANDLTLTQQRKPTVRLPLMPTGWTTGWSESAVTWSGQPNLATLANGAVVNSVASNFLLVRT